MIRRAGNGYDVESFDYRYVDLSSDIADLDGDGIPELSLMQHYSEYEGARGCQAEWTDIFRWNGTRYVEANSSFPAVYRKRLDALNATIDQHNSGPLAASPNYELEMSCDYMERDRIRRFLGIDSKAGLDRALAWAKSDSEQLKERAVIVLADIDELSAVLQLQTLTRDDDAFVAKAAQTALKTSHFH